MAAKVDESGDEKQKASDIKEVSEKVVWLTTLTTRVILSERQVVTLYTAYLQQTVISIFNKQLFNC